MKKALFIPFILSLVIMVISGLQINELRRVKSSLNNDFKKLTDKEELLRDINNTFGYGGFIHHFKNYILRGDKKYFDSLKANKFKIEK